MKLRARIGNTDYDIVQGFPISEELNETLDSGTITIYSNGKIPDLQPNDDVIIHGEETTQTFNGYSPQRTKEYEVRIEKIINQGGTVQFKAYLPDDMTAEDFSASEVYFEGINQSGFVHSMIGSVTDKSVGADGVINSITVSASSTPYGVTDGIKFVFQKANNWIAMFDATDETANPPAFYGGLTPAPFFIRYKTKGANIVSFNKHLLVNEYSCTKINISDDTQNEWKYTISLYSETKGLENIHLPNVSFTQPLNVEDKKSVWQVANDFLNQFSPKEKIAYSSLDAYSYENKYFLDETLKEVYDDIYAPDFSLNTPTLKDLLNQLFLTKDRIPYVKDGMIKALDISHTQGNFDTSTGDFTYITHSMSSANYCDNLRRNYSNALTGGNTCRMIEKMGFRNSDLSAGLLTLGNMRLEFSNPIYKINKMYMCYYKRIRWTQDGTTTHALFLCKQDITNLILLDEYRNRLPMEWEIPSPNMVDLSNSRVSTIGYSIGDTYIDGWGETYTYLPGNSIFDKTKSYLENIVNAIGNISPYGIDGEMGIRKFFGINADTTINFEDMDGTYATLDNEIERIIVPIQDEDIAGSENVGLSDQKLLGDNLPLRLKFITFEVDYDGFFNGTIVQTKDDSARDYTSISDNTNSSLTLLRKDGIFQKSKANRFGNEALQINARYDSIEDIQPLGSVYKDGEDEYIIYHREYSIFDNDIQCAYYATKNYVLKDYYTSVFAKLRVNSVMSYDESVKRSENRKITFAFSKTKSYYDNKKDIGFYDFANSEYSQKPIDYVEKVISAFKPTPTTVDNDNEIPYNNDIINMGIVRSHAIDYLADLNTFISGYSLCFNLRMKDNASMGTYISKVQPTLDGGITHVDDDYTGSKQEWHMITENNGFLRSIGFYVLHNDNSYVFEKYKEPDEDFANSKMVVAYSHLFDYPKAVLKIGEQKNIIGNYNYPISKDNKSYIDMTLQIDTVSKDRNVIISPSLIELSDLLGTKQKNNHNYEYVDIENPETVELYSTVIDGAYKVIGLIPISNEYPYFFIRMSSDLLTTLKSKGELLCSGGFVIKGRKFVALGRVKRYEINARSIKIVPSETPGEDDVEIVCEQKITSGYESGAENMLSQIMKIKLRKRNNYGNGHSFPQTDNYVYFTNMDFGITDGKTSFDIPQENKIYGGGIRYEPRDIDLSDKPENSYTTEDDKHSVNIFDKCQSSTLQIQGVSPTVCPENMFIVLSENEAKQGDIYELKTLAEVKRKKANYGAYKFDDLIKVTATNEYHLPYISIDMGTLQINNDLANVKSIQYWYYDDKENACKMVFAVNITNTEKSSGELKVYISVMSSNDKRVFDANHNQIGEVYNFAKSGNNIEYGEKWADYQYYQENVQNV